MFLSTLSHLLFVSEGLCRKYGHATHPTKHIPYTTVRSIMKLTKLFKRLLAAVQPRRPRRRNSNNDHPVTTTIPTPPPTNEFIFPDHTDYTHHEPVLSSIYSTSGASSQFDDPRSVSRIAVFDFVLTEDVQSMTSRSPPTIPPDAQTLDGDHWPYPSSIRKRPTPFPDVSVGEEASWCGHPLLHGTNLHRIQEQNRQVAAPQRQRGASQPAFTKEQGSYNTIQDTRAHGDSENRIGAEGGAHTAALIIHMFVTLHLYKLQPSTILLNADEGEGAHAVEMRKSLEDALSGEVTAPHRTHAAPSFDARLRAEAPIPERHLPPRGDIDIHQNWRATTSQRGRGASQPNFMRRGSRNVPDMRSRIDSRNLPFIEAHVGAEPPSPGGRPPLRPDFDIHNQNRGITISQQERDTSQLAFSSKQGPNNVADLRSHNDSENPRGRPWNRHTRGSAYHPVNRLPIQQPRPVRPDIFFALRGRLAPNRSNAHVARGGQLRGRGNTDPVMTAFNIPPSNNEFYAPREPIKSSILPMFDSPSQYSQSNDDALDHIARLPSTDDKHLSEPRFDEPRSLSLVAVSSLAPSDDVQSIASRPPPITSRDTPTENGPGLAHVIPGRMQITDAHVEKLGHPLSQANLQIHNQNRPARVASQPVLPSEQKFHNIYVPNTRPHSVPENLGEHARKRVRRRRLDTQNRVDHHSHVEHPRWGPLDIPPFAQRGRSAPLRGNVGVARGSQHSERGAHNADHAQPIQDNKEEVANDDNNSSENNRGSLRADDSSSLVHSGGQRSAVDRTLSESAQRVSVHLPLAAATERTPHISRDPGRGAPDTTGGAGNLSASVLEVLRSMRRHEGAHLEPTSRFSGHTIDEGLTDENIESLRTPSSNAHSSSQDTPKIGPRRPPFVSIGNIGLVSIHFVRSIRLAEFFAMIRECKVLQEFVVVLAETDSGDTHNGYLGHPPNLVTSSETLSNLGIVTSVEPSLILSGLHLPRLRELNITWNAICPHNPAHQDGDPGCQRKLYPQEGNLNLHEFFVRSQCRIRELTLTDIFPLETDLVQALWTPGLAHLVQLSIESTIPSPSVPFDGRLITNATVDTLLIACPILTKLELLPCHSDDGRLAVLVESKTNFFDLRLAYGDVEGRHNIDERWLKGLPLDRPWLRVIMGASWPVAST
ncbi:hypothetical protein DXG01_011771 [Tephrocybe rancida]|nr:hypothetical protein DXG01_011771 [Tephrocybe rancida]